MLSPRIIQRQVLVQKKPSADGIQSSLPHLMVLNKDKVYVNGQKGGTRVSANSNKLVQQINPHHDRLHAGNHARQQRFQDSGFRNKTSALGGAGAGIQRAERITQIDQCDRRQKVFPLPVSEMRELSGDNTVTAFHQQRTECFHSGQPFDIGSFLLAHCTPRYA